MKVLKDIQPTSEQLTILKWDPRKQLIINGAAGSGKTTTALLRLKFVVDFWQTQFAREGRQLKVLVLTYNRTLAGYVESLASAQVRAHAATDITVSTFNKWALELLDSPNVLQAEIKTLQIRELTHDLPGSTEFLESEVDYISGRYHPDDLDNYISHQRIGRGSSPSMPKKIRQQLINKVVLPFQKWKQSNNTNDWNDIAVKLSMKVVEQYDVIVVDETQDMTANQTRAILRQASTPSSITFVLDSAQRIYPHAFRWKDVGIDPGGSTLRLSRNYRNTRQIAAFARPLLESMNIDDDGAIPDFNSATRDGPIPKVIAGKFSNQLAFAIATIKNEIDLQKDSVAFLAPKGGGWFTAIKAGLEHAGLAYVDLTRRREFPQGPENIAISTMHSAKGLEFDHVFILGLNKEVTEHGPDTEDDSLLQLRRLLAMAIGRAKESLTLGYKPGEQSSLFTFLSPETYELISL